MGTEEQNPNTQNPDEVSGKDGEQDKTFNALAFEVGTNARDGRPVVEWSRDEDGKWSHEFFQLPVSADFTEQVSALQVAYGEQYYAAFAGAVR